MSTFSSAHTFRVALKIRFLRRIGHNERADNCLNGLDSQTRTMVLMAMALLNKAANDHQGAAKLLISRLRHPARLTGKQHLDELISHPVLMDRSHQQGIELPRV